MAMTPPPIIVSLDVATAAEAVRIARLVEGRVAGYKVGLGLLHGPGPGVIGAVSRIGPVLADAQLNDIPSQCERAARRLAEYGARWVSAHASGGREMLEAVRAGVDAGARTESRGVLAVTVLTSLDPSVAASVFGKSPGQMVARFSRIASDAGAEGIVCSTKELGVVADVAPGLVRVTPGIRLRRREDDQRRVATPAEAIERGADFLVIGRPITTAPDPVEAIAEMAASLESR